MKHILLVAFIFALGCTSQTTQDEEPAQQAATDPLPSWNDSQSRNQIIDFVTSVADTQSSDYVKPEDRIATFDNDGTLWSEQPVYFQLFFGMDMVAALMDEHPEWAEDPVMQAAAKRDIQGVMAGGMESLAKIVFVSHAEMSTEDFNGYARNWLDTARHPVTGRKFTEMVYQPMLELLDYLRENEFKVFIVSGGGIEFLRNFAPEVYGIPSERIIGSSLKLQFEDTDVSVEINRLPELNFVNDKEGKPVGIQNHIGKRPIAAFGNSDGDLQMLQWTAAGEGRRLMVYIHHTDADREYAYDRGSPIGGLDAGLDSAEEGGWTVVDMKLDWETIYP